MKRKAAITVSARTRYADAKREKMIYTVPGTIEDSAAGWQIVYDEPKDSGMEGTTTAFDVSSGRAVLTRSGAVNHSFIFSQGETQTTMYDTPYGRLSTELHTGVLRARLNRRGGAVELRYELTIGGAYSEHQLSLHIKTEGQS